MRIAVGILIFISFGASAQDIDSAARVLFHAKGNYALDKARIGLRGLLYQMSGEQAVQELNRLSKEAMDDGNLQTQVMLDLTLADLYGYQFGKRETAFFLYHKLYGISEQSGDEILQSQTAFSLGVFAGIFFNAADPEEAFRYIIIADKLFTEIGYTNCYEIVDKLDKIAGLFYGVQKYGKAREYLNKAFDLRDQVDDYGRRNSYNTMGLIHRNEGEYEDALQWMQKSLDIAIKQKDTTWIGLVTGNMGDVYHRMGDYKNALSRLKTDVAFSKGRLWYSGANAACVISQIYIKLKNHPEAKQWLDTARAFATREPVPPLTTLRDIEKTASELSAAMHDYEWAYRHYLQYVSYADTITAHFNIENLKKFEVDYELGSKQKDILLLEEQKSFETFRRNMLLLLTGALSLTGFLLYRSQRRKIAEEQGRREREQSEHELKQKLSDTKLHAARHDLEAFTRHILEKNELIESLKEQLQEPDGQEAGGKPAETPERIEAMHKLVNSTILTEEDWDEFKKRFEQVHKAFFSILKERYPELTLGDLRLLALTKLNLSTREMAHMLGISPDSVKKNRQRLRKKLGLLEDDSIEQKVLNF